MHDRAAATHFEVCCCLDFKALAHVRAPPARGLDNKLLLLFREKARKRHSLSGYEYRCRVSQRAHLGREGCPPCGTCLVSFADPRTPPASAWRARIRPLRLPRWPVLNSRPAVADSSPGGAPPPPQPNSRLRSPTPRPRQQKRQHRTKKERLPSTEPPPLSQPPPEQQQQTPVAAHDEKRPRCCWCSDRIRRLVIIPRDISAVAAAEKTARAGWTRPRGASHPLPLLEYN